MFPFSSCEVKESQEVKPQVAENREMPHLREAESGPLPEYTSGVSGRKVPAKGRKLNTLTHAAGVTDGRMNQSAGKISRSPD
ncbi:MAG: hypothetical protein P1U68_05495 [Verrucomicrobiales bacterium]|nr:hypothetical protein [Verrucomicrobiales bacterium]